MKYLLKIRVKFWGAFVSSHIFVITAKWDTNKVFPSKQKQPFTKFQYERPLDENHSIIPEDNRQTFSASRLFCRLSRHLWKLVVSCCNEKVGKNYYHIFTIYHIHLYHIFTIFLSMKVMVGLNLHFFFVSCKLSV